jgi:hypothetical protein
MAKADSVHSTPPTNTSAIDAPQSTRGGRWRPRHFAESRRRARQHRANDVRRLRRRDPVHAAIDAHRALAQVQS